jgi:hypothetical protein
MQVKNVQVLKKGRFQIGSKVTLPVGSAPAAPTAGPRDSRPCGPAQARIIESNSDYAILEILCSCGQKSFVQCNYGNVAVGG